MKCNGQTCGWMNEQTDGHIEERMDRLTDGKTDDREVIDTLYPVYACGTVN